jgi:DNA-directed RNA polymerase subunit E'/Rpb7
MDQLFERRDLTKKVHINSKFLQKNMQATILAQLKMSYEGRCSSEGFIQRNSITVIDFSLGRTNYIRGGVDYDVTFQADICFPHPGQQFKATVKARSKIGIHAETPPIKVLIPRDLHLGSTEFDTIKEGEEIDFEVIGSQFKQQDVEIIILGKLLSKTASNTFEPVVVPKLVAIQPTVESESEEKKVVITASVLTEAPKKRKLKRGGDSNVNEQLPSFEEGMVEGTA